MHKSTSRDGKPEIIHSSALITMKATQEQLSDCRQPSVQYVHDLILHHQRCDELLHPKEAHQCIKSWLLNSHKQIYQINSEAQRVLKESSLDQHKATQSVLATGQSELSSMETSQQFIVGWYLDLDLDFLLCQLALPRSLPFAVKTPW